MTSSRSKPTSKHLLV